jgi:hypothetical protein
MEPGRVMGDGLRWEDLGVYDFPFSICIWLFHVNEVQRRVHTIVHLLSVILSVR